MILKRYEYYGKNGKTWSEWFEWKGKTKEKYQYGKVLKNEFREICEQRANKEK